MMNISKKTNVDPRNNLSHTRLFMPESDISDSEPTYRQLGDNVDTDVSTNTQEEGDPPSPPLSRLAQYKGLIPTITGVALNNLSAVTDSDTDSDGDGTLEQTTSEATSTSESEDTQIWVPVVGRNGVSTVTQTPPLPSLTNSFTESPRPRHNTIPRYSSREMSSSGNNSHVTSPAETADEDKGRRHSWQESPEEPRKSLIRKVSGIKIDGQNGRTDSQSSSHTPNGDSGLGHDECEGSSGHDDHFYGDKPNNTKMSILKKRGPSLLQEVKRAPYDTTLIDSLFIVLSGLYAMIVVVLGAVMPIAKIFSSPHLTFVFESFYIYLNSLSIMFLLYAYVFLLQDFKKQPIPVVPFQSRRMSVELSAKKKYSYDTSRNYHTGSFYLRLGAVAFGVGSMIHSGLRVGQYFDSSAFSDCGSAILGVAPLLHVSFTFIQMYFVFLNSKMCIHRYKTLARFGLMHMIATNLCIWMESIVREALREIVKELPEESFEHNSSKHHENHTYVVHVSNNTELEHIKRDVPQLRCRPTSLMREVVESSGPYLYPCTVEYSLICAGILYVMWRNIGKGVVGRTRGEIETETKIKIQRMRVDCSGSSRGLFLGIFVLVGTVITMITFFVLTRSTEYIPMAIRIEHVTEIVIYVVTSIAILAGFHRMQSLSFSMEKKVDLEETLILVSVTGEYLYGFFSIIAAAINITRFDSESVFIIVSCVLGMFQATIQTVFLMHSLRRTAARREHERLKPGREFVTFLLVCNIALWGINTFENQRSQANPIQLEFYGVVAWNIFNHLAIPLAIFYRFHATVCLSNIWKNAWKRRFPNE